MKFAQTLLRIGDRILQGAARNVKHQSLTTSAEAKHALSLQRADAQHHERPRASWSKQRVHPAREEQGAPPIRKSPWSQADRLREPHGVLALASRPANRNGAAMSQILITATFILGPTTVGKTDVAFGLARQSGAEIMNADKFYLFDAIPEVTGQSDAHQYSDVKSHLYGVLRQDEDRWSDCKYGNEARGVFCGVRDRGSSIIVEGCSNAYIRAAIGAYRSINRGQEHHRELVIGLRRKNRSTLRDDCATRARQMMSLGMAPAFQRATRNGQGDRYLLKKCFAREPLLLHMRRKISATVCRSRVAEQLEIHALRQEDQLSRIPHVVWINHDRRNTGETIAKIANLHTAMASGARSESEQDL